MSDKTGTRGIPKNFWVTVAVLFPLFLCAYWIPLRATLRVWLTNGDYSYGFLIPVISSYIFWDMRDRFNGITFRNKWLVLPFLLFLVLVSVYAILGSSGNLSRPLVPLLFISFAAFCLGIEFVKKFIVPLGFLIFMVPLPAFLDRTLGVFLKGISSHMGGEILRLLGMSVYVSGNVIDLGVTQLQVVDACSGLRFLYPLMALGVLYAYFFEKVRWKQIICVLSTIPIAILTNVLRISITGILTYRYGPKMAEGFFHGFSGWAIFMVAFLFLFVEGRILRFFPPKNRHEIKRSKSGMARGSARWVGGNKALLVSIIILVTVALFSFNTGALPPVKINGGIGSFPLSFANWKGKKEIIDPEIISKSGAEEAFSGVYLNDKKEEVSLYIGYRGSAFLENENFFHSPTVCLPAAGWRELKVTTHQIEKVPGFGSIEVTEMVVEYLGQKNLVYFWFQTKDKATYNKNINRFHLALHAIHKDNTYDLFIRLITPIQEVDMDNEINENKLRASQKRLDNFAREMMGALLRFLEENRVER